MRTTTPRRIVLTTFGSHGDLQPLLIVGRGLRDRGYLVRVATAEPLRAHVEREAFEFHAVRPHILPDDLLSPLTTPDAATEMLLRDVLFSNVSESYADLLAACRDADLLISHMLAVAAPLVAAATGMRWISVVLQPLGFLSKHEPLVTFSATTASGLEELALPDSQIVWASGRAAAHSWAAPVRALRRQIGLPMGGNALYDDHHAPGLVLACFSPLFARPRPDWPSQTRVTGFPFDDREVSRAPSAVETFLSRGDSPVVVTMGSHAPYDLDGVHVSTIRAALALQRRVLVLGQGTQAYVDEACADQPWHREHVRAFEYVPYAHVFPRAAAIVHHGGIGSIAAALRAGKPMLLVPLGFDQLHNAWRAAHLGFARVVAGHCYTLPRAMRELALLLRDTRTRQAAACGSIVLRQEAGTPAACDAIEEFLARPRPPRAGSKSKGDAHLRHASRRLAPSRVHDRRRLSD